MFKLFLAILTFISSVKCDGYYFVTAPNVIRFEHEEVVIVNVFDLKNARVKVWLQYRERQFSEHTVVVENEEKPVSITVKVTEDLFDPAVEEKPRRISVCAEYVGKLQCREVVLSYRTGYLFVETDKPIYTPQQKVKVRTLALDESLRAVNGWRLGIDLISPSNYTILRETMADSVSGFFENEFRLPAFPETGLWTARAFYLGQLETESQTLFEVQQYKKSTFDVTVEVDTPYILHNTDKIRVTVKARYVYGKPVKGSARLTLYLKNESGKSEYILEVNRKMLQTVSVSDERSEADFNFKVVHMLESPLLQERGFPVGCRLEIVAAVFERATGEEKISSHAGTVFSVEPYFFKFVRSKRYFQPGFEYFLKGDILYVNGQTAEGKTFRVKMFKNGDFVEGREATTDNKGQIVSVFTTSTQDDTIAFTVETVDETQESERFEVQAYSGKNRILVEHVYRDGALQLETLTNVMESRYTGMFSMVVTRGKVVNTKFTEAFNHVSEAMTEEMQELISPSARLLVFYVDKSTNEIVADSSKLEVVKKCRGAGLKIETEKTVVGPGASNILNISGDPLMWIGLHVMERRQSNENVLQKSKMFLAMESHDIGCGPGGGRNSADVFKKTGLTLLTNAKISEEDLQRTSNSCGGLKRRKRESGDLDTILKPFKDEFGSDMAKLEDAGVIYKIREDFRESLLFEVEQLNNTGHLTRTLYYPDSVTEWTIRAIGVTADKGICIAESADVFVFKEFFVQLDLPYKVARFEQFEVKASIFNYKAAQKRVNVNLESVEGLCYNSESGRPTLKMQIEVPPNSFRTIRFPVIPLQKGEFPIRVIAVVTDGLVPEFDAVEKKINVVSEGIEEQILIQVCLDPNNQNKDCQNDARVTKTETYYSEKGATSLIEVELAFPEYSIPGTARAVGYLQSVVTDSISSVIEDLHSSFTRPIGSGLTTIAYLAKNVYTLTYLKQTKQHAADIGVRLEQWIRYGVTRARNVFMHPDGSYSIYKTQQSSTWLTAFAAKVFCQTEKILDDISLEKDILLMIHWLARHVTTQGSFIEKTPIKNRHTITGQVKETDSSLTAYVLITLLECNIKKEEIVDDAVMQSTVFLENLPKNALRNYPYLLALSAYALAKTKSPKVLQLRNSLHDIWNKDGEGIHWVNASANSVETTGYALLAMIELNDLRNSEDNVRWMVSQIGEDISLNRIQETVIGLQSLSAYFSASENLDLKVQILGRDRPVTSFRLTRDNTIRQLLVRNLPVENNHNSLMIEVAGVGAGKLTIDLRYNRPATDEEFCPYNISDIGVDETFPTDANLENEGNCDVCGLCERDPVYYYDCGFGSTYDSLNEYSDYDRKKRQTRRNAQTDPKTTCIRFSVSSKSDKVFGMTVVNVGLESSVQFVKDDLDKLLNDVPNIVSYEMPNNGRDFVVFYLKEVTLEKTNFTFRLTDVFNGDVNLRHISSVKVYDYYNPDHACTRFPGSGSRQSSGLNYICDEQYKQCQCLPRFCSHPVDVLRLNPELLYQFTCNPDRANYAVIVEIDNVEYDPITEQKLASGIAVKILLKGFQQLEAYDDMEFFWSIKCDQPELKVGRQYYIIGKNRYMFSTLDGKKYRYSLMLPTLIVEKPTRRRDTLFRIMQIYERTMQTKGCLI